MISADACQQAAELLAEREELFQPLAEMLKAKRLRLSYQTAKPSYTRDDGSQAFTWVEGPEIPPTTEFRKLLTAGLLAEIAKLDAQLVKLGVTPPEAPSA